MALAGPSLPLALSAVLSSNARRLGFATSRALQRCRPEPRANPEHAALRVPAKSFAVVERCIARLAEPLQGYGIVLARGMKCHLPPYVTPFFGVKPRMQTLQ